MASLKISRAETFLKTINSDYLNYFKSGGNYEKQYQQFLKLYNYFENYRTQIYNEDAYLTINNIFVQNNVDFPIFTLNFKNKIYSYNSGEDWNSYLLNKNNNKVFNVSLSSFDDLKVNEIPVIITKHFSILNKYSLNDVLDIPLSRIDANSNFKFKVIGINDDNVSNNFYTTDELFYEHLTNNITSLTNKIFTTRQTIINKKINANYFNFLYQLDSNKQLPLADLVQQQSYSFISPNSFGSNYYENLSLERKLINQKVENFNQLMDVILFVSVMLTFILFIMYVFVNLNDKQQKTFILKALGYRNFELTHYISFNFALNFIFTNIISGFVCYGLWKLIVNLLQTSGAKLVIGNVIFGSDIAIVLAIIFMIFGLGYLLTYIFIKNIFKWKNF